MFETNRYVIDGNRYTEDQMPKELLHNIEWVEITTAEDYPHRVFIPGLGKYIDNNRLPL